MKFFKKIILTLCVKTQKKQYSAVITWEREGMVTSDRFSGPP